MNPSNNMDASCDIDGESPSKGVHLLRWRARFNPSHLEAADGCATSQQTTKSPLPITLSPSEIGIPAPTIVLTPLSASLRVEDCCD